MATRKSMRPRNIREYAANLATAPLTGFWGQRLTALLALGFDALVEATRLSTLARTTDPRLAPPDAQDARGADTFLPRFPGEASEAYGTRLRSAWKTWQGAGSAKCMEEQLAAMGVTAKLRNALDPALQQSGNTSWSRINVEIQSHPWRTDRRVGDGSIVGDGSTVGSSASRDEIEALRHILRTFKEAHYVIDDFALSPISPTVLALQPWSWARADRFAEVGGALDAFVDIVDGSHLYAYLPRGGSSVRAPKPAPSPTTGGAMAALLNGSGDNATSCGYRSTRTTAAWGFLRTGLYDVWVVHRPRTTDGIQIYLTSGDGGTNRSWDYWGSTTSNLARNAPEVSATLATNHGTDFRIVHFRGAANGGMLVERARASGTSVDTITGHTSALVDVSTGNPMCIGMQSASLLYSANMEFCELLVFNRSLSAPEEASVWAYLEDRYSIPHGAL